MLGTFQDPVKKVVLPDPPEEVATGSKFRSNLPVAEHDSIWFDEDDFVELDWSPSNVPVVNLLRAAECPHFVYSKCPVEKQNAKIHQQTVFSKFGNEDTHSCYLGKEPCKVPLPASDNVALMLYTPHSFRAHTGEARQRTNRGIAGDPVPLQSP